MAAAAASRPKFPTPLLLLLLVFFAAATTAEGARPGCGYAAASCNPTSSSESGKLNVHLVPHTHDDVGWLKTVDQYYYGAGYGLVGVQYILDSVVQELARRPDRRFVYVEVAYFWRWWRRQPAATRRLARRLVAAGRLQFANGGWSMNDEAATHYNAVVDQMTWGLRRLRDAFGECARPRVAWHVDTFGHSKEHANLFARMGFDGIFFGRLDREDKRKRSAERAMEMLWEGRAGEPGSRLFAGALFNLYQPPPGFCFDVPLCGNDPPVMDDERLRGYNVEERVAEFARLARLQSRSYRTRHVMATMGSDFTYSNAHVWFDNMDRLIRHVNARVADVHVLYSTPWCYLKAVNDEDVQGRGKNASSRLLSSSSSSLPWPLKTDDFFPYSNDPHSYWTGFFTSRPALKGMIRRANNLLQVCKQLNAMTMTTTTSPDDDEKVTVLREAMGVAQHHDAVTGTARQDVTFDYAERLHHGVESCSEVVADALHNGLTPRGSSGARFCHLLNVSQCEVTERSRAFIVNVYNPLARPVSKFVRLPVKAGSYQVRDGDDGGTRLVTQLVSVPAPVLRIPGRMSIATHELLFRASDVPPLGSRSYHVSRTAGNSFAAAAAASAPFLEGADEIGFDDAIRVTVNRFGRIKRVGPWKLSQKFGWYEGFAGNNSRPELRSSGAYIFRPTLRAPHPFRPRSEAAAVEKGPLVHEVRQQVNPWLSQVVRVYHGESDVELEWLVGPIPIDDLRGKEIVSLFEASVVGSRGRFLTDANGRQMVERRRDFRPTWNLTVTEPVAGNYYPVNSRVVVSDSENGNQMTVLTDRSQGGTSMKDGQVELMLHRRLLHDDAFGVGEPLNETAFSGVGLVVRGKHWLQISPGGRGAARKHRLKAQQAFMDVQLTFVETDLTFEEWAVAEKGREPVFRLFHPRREVRFPDSLHLLTLEKWRGDGEVLVRLEHQFDVGEDPELSQRITVDLADLFSGGAKVSRVEELALGANVALAQLTRLRWGDDIIDDDKGARAANASFTSVVTLDPMQIRTFVVTLSKL